MASDQNGRISKIEELIIKHDERMDALQLAGERHTERMDELQHALENTERLLVMEGDRIDRLDRIEARQSELFAEISEQLRHLGNR